eukprot:8661120-Pyramimonas_sp.AAC.1
MRCGDTCSERPVDTRCRGTCCPCDANIHLVIHCWAAWNSNNNRRVHDAAADRARSRAGGWIPHR